MSCNCSDVQQPTLLCLLSLCEHQKVPELLLPHAELIVRVASERPRGLTYQLAVVLLKVLVIYGQDTVRSLLNRSLVDAMQQLPVEGSPYIDRYAPA